MRFTFLLLDENLSYRIKYLLRDVFREIQHVSALQLEGRPDEFIHAFARKEGWLIATYDKDFVKLASIHGPPPHVVRIRNISGKISGNLRNKTAQAIRDFVGAIGDESFSAVEIALK